MVKKLVKIKYDLILKQRDRWLNGLISINQMKRNCLKISKIKTINLTSQYKRARLTKQHWTKRKRRQLNRPEDNVIDHIEIFNKEKAELVAKGYLPVKPGISDDEAQLIINDLTDREKLLEKAIEELRYKRHAVLNAKDEYKAQLSNERRRQQDESDMNDRQKKQVAKIDRQVNVKQLKTSVMVDALRDLGKTDEEIKDILAKRGLTL
jgi:hypothetical protein